MKYIYILLFALSSFFSNKSLHAEETYKKLAFFMPDNAMQNNMYIPSAYQNNNYYNPTYTPPQATSQQPTKKQQKRAIKQNPKQNKMSKTNNKKITKKQDYSQNSPKNTSSKKEATQPQEAIMVEETIKTQPALKTDNTDFSAFDFDENIQISTQKTPEPVKIKKVKKISKLEKLRQKDLSDLLYSIPYPDTTQPKYKQIYNLYALSLRSLYKYHSLPSNYEQDISLEKANSLQKFEVK